MSSLIRICDKPHNGLMKDSMVFTLAEMGRQMCARLKRVRYFYGNCEYIFGF
jgi:hypothetical protein